MEADSHGLAVQQTIVLPLLQYIDKVFDIPVVCNDVVDDMALFIDRCGRPCDHAETVATMEVPQSWWTFSFATEGSAWWRR